MPKQRGGKNSEQARRGGAEPAPEYSGSEDEPMGEPPLPTPYMRQQGAEAQTALESPKTDAPREQSTGQPLFIAMASTPGYTPRSEEDRVLLFMRAQCRAGAAVDVAVCVALRGPLRGEGCGHAVMEPFAK